MPKLKIMQFVESIPCASVQLCDDGSSFILLALSALAGWLATSWDNCSLFIHRCLVVWQRHWFMHICHLLTGLQQCAAVQCCHWDNTVTAVCAVCYCSSDSGRHDYYDVSHVLSALAACHVPSAVQHCSHNITNVATSSDQRLSHHQLTTEWLLSTDWLQNVHSA